MSVTRKTYQGAAGPRRIVACDVCPRSAASFAALVAKCPKATCGAREDEADPRISHRGGGWYEVAGHDKAVHGYAAARALLEQTPDPESSTEDTTPTQEDPES